MFFEFKLNSVVIFLRLIFFRFFNIITSIALSLVPTKEKW